jgi:hypothetical protein
MLELLKILTLLFTSCCYDSKELEEAGVKLDR